MAVKRSKSTVRITVGIVLLLVLAAVSVIAFQGKVLTFFSSPSSADRQLLNMVSVEGTVKVEDLKLSQAEIKKINYAALKHRTLFPNVNVTVNMGDKYAPVIVEGTTRLELTMVFNSDEEAEVRSWSRMVTRSKLVPFMLKSMNKAASEYVHYRDLPGRKREFKRLYI